MELAEVAVVMPNMEGKVLPFKEIGFHELSQHKPFTNLFPPSVPSSKTDISQNVKSNLIFSIVAASAYTLAQENNEIAAVTSGFGVKVDRNSSEDGFLSFDMLIAGENCGLVMVKFAFDEKQKASCCSCMKILAEEFRRHLSRDNLHQHMKITKVAVSLVGDPCNTSRTRSHSELPKHANNSRSDVPEYRLYQLTENNNTRRYDTMKNLLNFLIKNNVPTDHSVIAEAVGMAIHFGKYPGTKLGSNPFDVRWNFNLRIVPNFVVDLAPQLKNYPFLLAIHPRIFMRSTLQPQRNYQSLHQLIENDGAGKSCFKKAMYFGKQLFEALAYLHEKEIVSRCFQAQNILIINNCLKIALDTACHIDYLSGKVDVSKLLPLVPVAYWAPEVLKKSRYNFKSEIWAAGCLLYEIAFKDNPWAVYAEEDEQPHDYYTSALMLGNNFKVRYPENISPQLEELLNAVFIESEDKRSSASEILELTAVALEEYDDSIFDYVSRLHETVRATQPDRFWIRMAIESRYQSALTVDPNLDTIDVPTVLKMIGFKDFIVDAFFSQIPFHLIDLQPASVWAMIIAEACEEYTNQLITFSRYPYNESVRNQWFRVDDLQDDFSWHDDWSRGEIQLYNISDDVKPQELLSYVKGILPQPEDGKMLWFHATRSSKITEILGSAKLDGGSPTQDFSHLNGFYLHEALAPAVEWAYRVVGRNPGDNDRSYGALLIFETEDKEKLLREDDDATPGLNFMTTPENPRVQLKKLNMSGQEAWSQTITFFRSGGNCQAAAKPLAKALKKAQWLYGSICTNARAVWAAEGKKIRQPNKKGARVDKQNYCDPLGYSNSPNQLCIKQAMAEKFLDYLKYIVFF